MQLIRNRQELEQILILMHREGRSIHQLSRQFQLGRCTIRRILRAPHVQRQDISYDVLRRRLTRASKLDRFDLEIKKLIERYPKITGVRMYEELKHLGYAGGISILRERLAKMRPPDPKPLMQCERNEEYFQRLRKKDTKKNELIPINSDLPAVRIRNKDFHCLVWIYLLITDYFDIDALRKVFHDSLPSDNIGDLYEYFRGGSSANRNRAVSVLAHYKHFPNRSISRCLRVDVKSVRGYIKRYQSGGIPKLFNVKNTHTFKSHQQEYKDAVFNILHSPPSAYGINRTSWIMDDLHQVMKNKGLSICKDIIRSIIKDAGYKFRKAKKVLTSTDPDYHAKLKTISSILANLKPNEYFFSIDEFGPFSIKIRGGRCLVLANERRTFPQRQKSKGSLLLTGALELSTNQMTHFYSPKKNTDEMIKLLNLLLEKYSIALSIYLSWDGASWHVSRKLLKVVDTWNAQGNGTNKPLPKVYIAPLPRSAQFLNVIESVFSGMARAIIHNSDYKSESECRSAIDRYFAKRNEYFKLHPKRAGNKIWGKEREEAQFSESNNCKDPLCGWF